MILIKKQLFLIMLISNFCFSQNKNFKIVYEIQTKEHKIGNKEIKSSKNELIVLGTKNYAVSMLKENISYKVKKGKNEETYFTPETKTYKNYSKNEYFKEMDLMESKILVKGDLNFYKWKIQPETKIIDGYKCKKAVSEKYDTSITCWFTDQIGIHVAPEEFDGLPGTIIYAIVKYPSYKEHYKLKKISYPKKIELPKVNMKLKIYSEKEFYSKDFITEERTVINTINH